MKRLIPILFIVAIFSLVFISCGKKNKTEPESSEIRGEDIAYNPGKDEEIQRYNLEMLKQRTKTRTPCDTIALMEYILNKFERGTYLVYFDKTTTYNIPRPAVIYFNQGGNQYIFGVIVRNKPGERLIEPKNIIGYDQSFIDLDSTELGTAFFSLALFACDNGNFSVVWETPIPSHGGFNNISLHRWKYRNTPFVRVNFHYARGIGHIDYNYFLVRGTDLIPHLLMTYKGIDFQRTIANVNDDRYPDYYEYLFYNLPDRIYARDSIAFIWNLKDSVYVNTRNSKQTRPY
jgi:hypothetical protein